MIAIRNLWFHRVPWAYYSVNTVASAFLTTLGVVAFRSVDEYSEVPGKQYLSGLVGPAVGLVLLAACIALSITSKQLLTQLRKSMASFVLAGYGPVRIGALMFSETVVVAFGMSLLGATLTLPFAPTLVSQFTRAMFDLEDASSDVSVSDVLVAVIFVVCVTIVSVGPALRRATQVAPLEAIKDSSESKPSFSWGRAAATALSLSACVGLILEIRIGIPNSDYPLSDKIKASTLAGIALLASLIVFIISIGPVLYLALIRIWTAIFPRRVSLTWFLARKAATWRIVFSANIVTALFFPVTIASGLFSLAFTAASMGGPNADVNVSSILAVLVGPVSLSVVGGVVSILMAAGRRDKDVALLSATGVSPTQSILSALLEALIYVVTALMLAVTVNVVVVGLLVGVLRDINVPATPVIYWSAIAGLGVVSFLMIAVATVMPTCRSVLRSPLDALAKDL